MDFRRRLILGGVVWVGVSTQSPSHVCAVVCGYAPNVCGISPCLMETQIVQCRSQRPCQATLPLTLLLHHPSMAGHGLDLALFSHVVKLCPPMQPIIVSRASAKRTSNSVTI